MAEIFPIRCKSALNPDRKQFVEQIQKSNLKARNFTLMYFLRL